MKVKHLIRELQKCDPELPVIMAGYDDDGESFCVELDVDAIYIKRPQGKYLEYASDYKNDQDTPLPLK